MHANHKTEQLPQLCSDRSDWSTTPVRLVPNVWILGSVLVVVVLVVGVGSLQVVILLDVLYLVLDTRVGGVVVLRWRGGTVHDLPFVVFVLL
jgi:hypothetical protein